MASLMSSAAPALADGGLGEEAPKRPGGGSPGVCGGCLPAAVLPLSRVQAPLAAQVDVQHFDSMSWLELSSACKKRGLNPTGRKNELIARLVGGPGAGQHTPRHPQDPPQVMGGHGAPLTAVALAAALPSVQKKMIGEKLYSVMARSFPELAGKLTGMLLEMDNSVLLTLLDSEQQLWSRVDEALRVLEVGESSAAGLRGGQRTPQRSKAPPQTTGGFGAPSDPAAFAAASPSVQKQMIGETLFSAIVGHLPLLACKITGMMLEMDNRDLLPLLESEQQLKTKVEVALRGLATDDRFCVGPRGGQCAPQLSQASSQAVGGLGAPCGPAAFEAASPFVQKRTLGKKLLFCFAIAGILPLLVSKITMMLREMDNRDLLILLESEHHLSDKVGAALRDVNKSFRFVRSIFLIYLSLTPC